MFLFVCFSNPGTGPVTRLGWGLVLLGCPRTGPLGRTSPGPGFAQGEPLPQPTSQNRYGAAALRWCRFSCRPGSALSAPAVTDYEALSPHPQSPC